MNKTFTELAERNARQAQRCNRQWTNIFVMCVALASASMVYMILCHVWMMAFLVALFSSQAYTAKLQGDYFVERFLENREDCLDLAKQYHE